MPEESLVKSVMYAIQGIDSKYSRYVQRNGVSFFEIDPSYGVPKTHRVLMKQLCELGWLYKKVQTHAMTAISAEGSPPPHTFALAGNPLLIFPIFAVAGFLAALRVCAASLAIPLPIGGPVIDLLRPSASAFYPLQRPSVCYSLKVHRAVRPGWAQRF